MLMKYKDFKQLSNDDMKQIVGGLATSNFTYCGTCTNMNGTALEKSQNVCSSVPSGSTCTNVGGQYGVSFMCASASGSVFTADCANFENI